MKNLRIAADFYYWALTLRLTKADVIEQWATATLNSEDFALFSLVELSTCGALDTESILDQLRKVPGERNNAATFEMLMRFIAERYFEGLDGLSYTVRLCEAIQQQFEAPGEEHSVILSMCNRWDGVEYGYGESENVFRKAFEEMLKSYVNVPEA